MITPEQEALEDTIKDCPFCGNKGKVCFDWVITQFSVECHDCKIGTKYESDIEVAAKAWNNRIKPQEENK